MTRNTVDIAGIVVTDIEAAIGGSPQRTKRSFTDRHAIQRCRRGRLVLQIECHQDTTWGNAICKVTDKDDVMHGRGSRPSERNVFLRTRLDINLDEGRVVLSNVVVTVVMESACERPLETAAQIINSSVRTDT